MKTEKAWKYLRLVLALVLGGAMTSCADEDGLNADDASDKDFTGVELVIPREGFGTRSLDVDAEARMSNLYLVAIQDEDRNGIRTSTVVIRALDPPHNNKPINDPDGDRYTVNLYPGVYRFYVLANLDLYLDKRIQEITKEQELKDLKLNFRTDTRLIPSHLPMACLPKDIEGGTKNQNGETVIRITDNTVPTITANMSFLCSKVRYTILYDNTPGGMSEAFNIYSLRFNVDPTLHTVASKLRRYTYLDPGHPTSDEDNKDPFLRTESYAAYPGGEYTATYDLAYWNIDLDRYKFKGESADGLMPFNPNYPESAADNSLELWTDDLAAWQASRRRVWQGVAYLPENNTQRIDEHTVLAFPFVMEEYAHNGLPYQEKTDWNPSDFKLITLFGGNTNETHYGGGSGSGDKYGDQSNPGSPNGDGFSHGLVRDYFYDVVARVKTPDRMAIDVYVKVKDWDHEGVTDSW